MSPRSASHRPRKHWKALRDQVDLLMLDFCKAFDTVPHQHLLKKLKYYGINGKLCNWLST